MTAFVVFAVSQLPFAGCQQKMADQPSYKPLEASNFFADGRSARPVVAGTVARGYLRTDTAFFTGRVQPASTAAPTTAANSTESQQAAAPAAASNAGAIVAPAEVVPPAFRDDAAFVREMPVAVSEPMLEHGYNRYMIYCVVCHDPLATGHGKIVERGYTPPPSLHIDRLRNAPVGRIFAVMTEGYGSMPSYASDIPPEDRWAIVAYVRALQLSQRFPKNQLSPDMQKEFAASLQREVAP
jgi:mono/diheme cytochrome c family protein